MADLSFTQQERRNYLVPALVALLVLSAAFGYLYWRSPHGEAKASVTRVADMPIHTVLDSGSRLVGVGDQAQDDLYVVASLHIDNPLHVPLFLKDFTASYTAPDDTVTNASAVEEGDLKSIEITFPALKPMVGTPLLRETSVAPNTSADGTIVLHFPMTEAEWNQRKSATVTIDFYHQDSITIPIPKP